MLYDFRMSRGLDKRRLDENKYYLKGIYRIDSLHEFISLSLTLLDRVMLLMRRDKTLSIG